jgi:thiamine-monophosphate kinase
VSDTRDRRASRKRRVRLGTLGEHGWIGRLLDRLPSADRRVVVGPGDDAAVVRASRRPLVLTTDTLREGVHFRQGWIRPAALGRRAFLVNASDVAAMGGTPAWALVAVEAPARTPVATLDRVVAGFAAEARRAGATLVGGNLVAGPALALTVALVGEAPGRVVTRAGARAGDTLWVTGALGAAGTAVARLRAGRRDRLPLPPRRTAAGVALAAVAHAMIDVSDGLVQDVGHLCRASGVGAELALDRLPVAASCRRMLGARAAAFAAVAGEDYELVIAVPARALGRLARIRRRLGCRLTEVGRVVAGRPAVRVLGPGGRHARVAHPGFDHFR